MTSFEINARFDDVVLSDREIETAGTTNFPKSEIIQKSLHPPLKYSPDKKLWSNNLSDIFDHSPYTETEKIEFIKDALADPTRDAFQYINDRAINFWRTSTEATALIDGYFKSKRFEDSDDRHSKYKYLEFKTKSLYPDTYSLIMDYFAARNRLEVKYYHEGDLIYRLILLDKEEEAVRFLEILIEDYLNDKVDHLELGNRQEQFYKGFVFDFLCFSKDETIAKKSTDLLFDLLTVKNFETYRLYPLTAYLDKTRHLQLLEKWYNYYSSLDFTIIDLEELKSNGWRKTVYPLMPKATEYIDFMSLYFGDLGEKYGIKFWEEFLSKSPYTQLYDSSPFESWQFNTLESVFRNKSLTLVDKRTILFQAIKTERFFSYDYHSRMLRLVVQAYPDRKIEKDDFEKLQLTKILEYAYPLEIDPYQLQIRSYLSAQLLDEDKINNLTADLNNFAQNNDLSGITLSRKDRFFLSLGTVEGYLWDFFQRHKMLIGFDPESAVSPTNYIDFFESSFQSVLAHGGFPDFKISQLTRRMGGDFIYNLFVKYHQAIYELEYAEQGTDWYQPQRLVKMLNLCLIENNSKRRLLEIETDDQAAVFLFVEPARVKPLLDKYNMGCWALRYQDDFHTLER